MFVEECVPVSGRSKEKNTGEKAEGQKMKKKTIYLLFYCILMF